MFQSFNDWPPPPPDEPPDRRPRLTVADERRLVWLLCLFLLTLFFAPIAGGSLFEAARAVWGR